MGIQSGARLCDSFELFYSLSFQQEKDLRPIEVRLFATETINGRGN